MANYNELRERIVAAYGEGKFLAQLDALIAENERLLALEAGVLRMADQLRNGFWEPSPETGAVLEIHAAITGPHVDLEEVAIKRDKLAEQFHGGDPAKRVAGVAS